MGEEEAGQVPGGPVGTFTSRHHFQGGISSFLSEQTGSLLKTPLSFPACADKTVKWPSLQSFAKSRDPGDVQLLGPPVSVWVQLRDFLFGHPIVEWRVPRSEGQAEDWRREGWKRAVRPLPTAESTQPVPLLALLCSVRNSALPATRVSETFWLGIKSKMKHLPSTAVPHAQCTTCQLAVERKRPIKEKFLTLLRSAVLPLCVHALSLSHTRSLSLTHTRTLQASKALCMSHVPGYFTVNQTLNEREPSPLW